MKKFLATRKEAAALCEQYRKEKINCTFTEGEYAVSDDFVFELDDATVESIVKANPQWDIPDGEKHGNAVRCIQVNRLNLLKTLHDLDGENHQVALGADCMLDRVGINQWKPDTCGCHTSFIYRIDHRNEWIQKEAWRKDDKIVFGGKTYIAARPMAPNDGDPSVNPDWKEYSPTEIRQEYIGHRTKRKCEAHMHHTDPKVHYQEIKDEVDHKNAAVGAVAEHLGVPANDIGFRHEEIDGARTLVVVHPTLQLFGAIHAKDALRGKPEIEVRPVELKAS